ncbi:MAG TPA: hypothetical protein EYP10_12455 [Armatimonadetes bacterium]|nr:hypothetical protein [Armatimonadota bacterium]
MRVKNKGKILGIVKRAPKCCPGCYWIEPMERLEAISGAQVKLIYRRLSDVGGFEEVVLANAVTDEEGRYEIEAYPNDYIVQIKHKDYVTCKEHISLAPAQKMELKSNLIKRVQIIACPHDLIEEGEGASVKLWLSVRDLNGMFVETNVTVTVRDPTWERDANITVRSKSDGWVSGLCGEFMGGGNPPKPWKVLIEADAEQREDAPASKDEDKFEVAWVRLRDSYPEYFVTYWNNGNPEYENPVIRFKVDKSGYKSWEATVAIYEIENRPLGEREPIARITTNKNEVTWDELFGDNKPEYDYYTYDIIVRGIEPCVTEESDEDDVDMHRRGGNNGSGGDGGVGGKERAEKSMSIDVKVTKQQLDMEGGKLRLVLKVKVKKPKGCKVENMKAFVMYKGKKILSKSINSVNRKSKDKRVWEGEVELELPFWKCGGKSEARFGEWKVELAGDVKKYKESKSICN